MSDYAELVKRLQGNAGVADCLDAADAIKALEARIAELGAAIAKSCDEQRDEAYPCGRARIAESALAECLKHADLMASAPNQELLNADREAYRAWRAKQ